MNIEEIKNAVNKIGQETNFEEQVAVLNRGLFEYVLDSLNELAEYKKKVENGTLIELPRMFQDLSGLGWYVEWLDECGFAIHCHFCDKDRAKAKLKELKGEV